MDAYRSRDWKNFRAEVLRLDNYTCTVCGRTAQSGAVLQVHHKRYLFRHKPWEYPHALCAAVCKRCHAAEHGLVAPKVGWTHEGWEDLGDLSGRCELCDTEIRYVFLVHHPKWRTMEVGEICCDNLTSTTLATSQMESLRRFLGRRKTFVSSTRWRQHSQTHQSIAHKGFFIEVLWTPVRFQIEVNGIRGKQAFASMLEAKMEVFEVIESGRLTAYMDRVRKRRSRESRPTRQRR